MSFSDELAGLGLDQDEVLFHQNVVIRSASTPPKTFPILDTCRLDNGRILSLPSENICESISGIWAFVPAAGASSRYNQPIRNWKQKNGVDDRPRWPLPTDCTLPVEASSADLLAMFAQPKALLPCVEEGESFLQMKMHEHLAVGVEGQVIVTPSGWNQAFDDSLASCQDRLPYIRVEQGLAQSTVRFLPDGTPARDSAGSLSVVPAGHGALVGLFPQLNKDLKAKNADSIWIRNVDNVSGVQPHVVSTSRAFLQVHRRILDDMKLIRSCVSVDLNRADELARELCRWLVVRELDVDEKSALLERPSTERTVWAMLLQLFNLPLRLCADPSLLTLTEALMRPVNTMGMVANDGKDIGGSPVIVDTDVGPTVICLELPHVNCEQVETILKDPAQMTHFNPVFVASELSDNNQAYRRQAPNYAILAEKMWKERRVVYYETLLYELLGNSSLANMLFIELPRFVFNPHKTIDQTIGKSLKDWGF